jgi:chemotaxis protein MotB
MKKLQLLLITAIAGSSMLMTSCVSKGKFLTAQKELNRLQQDSASTHGLLGECTNNLTTCNVDKRNLEAERDRLTGKVENTQKSLQDYANKSRLTIEEQAARLKSLQDLIGAQRNAMNKLKKTIADALVNFKSDELHVSVQDGKVYVSLEEKLLFKSGSAVVDPKGREALGKLAQVLNVTEDISVTIEGHTDTVPIKNERFEDNWALSVSRAASIVRILTKDGADPHRISAAGRGEFHPVADNTTPQGKGMNRRTEIIISPNLNELYKLLGE